ncbi:MULTISPECIES: hypothetical protein [unclassified Leucobacter]|uniref:hypothetical protein n=1 Tax=unclassified Leucobacter TaxID=2621730 RepID=UPI00117A5807|nr:MULTISPECIES: hypothetical protein [unclassified Leucobacter]
MRAPTARSDRMNPRRMLPIAAISAIIGTLVWLLWALPISGSVRDAHPQVLGEPIAVTLESGERAGIWTDSAAAALETLECTAIDERGGEIGLRRAPALSWDDALWWATPRSGFEQVRAFTAPSAGAVEVRCVDRMGVYGGGFLIAGDSFGSGSIGLGRTGGNDFAVGTILVFCAVVCPLLAAFLLVLSVIGAVTRRAGR